MQGRFSQSFKILAAVLGLTVMAGCEQPRVKSYESAQAATLTNPPRDFKAEPLDPYSWGGIAMASGGRETRTTYGAMALGNQEGADEVFLPGTQPKQPANDTSRIYLVPDPRTEKKSVQYLGSDYTDNEAPGHAIAGPGVVDPAPPRAGEASGG